MKALFIAAAGVIDYIPSANVAAGDVVIVNGRVGVAKTAITAGCLGALCLDGIFAFEKANESINDGAAIYWDADGNPYGGTAGTGCATTTSAGNTFVGYAVGAAGATATTVQVSLFGGLAPSVTIKGPLDTVIADPGNAGAIPVTASGSVAIVTAGAETRTLAAPSFAGQQILIGMKTDGGNAVVTASAAVNQTGNTVLTFADAGDTILLVGVEVGGNKVWRVAANDGVDLSTP